MRGSAVTTCAVVAAATLGLAACASGGQHANGVVPPPATSTTAPAVTASPAVPTVIAPTTTAAAPTASPTPTTGDAAIFAGVQAYSDGFVAAVQQRDIAPLKAVVDPKSDPALLNQVVGLLATLHRMHWEDDYSEAVTALRRTKEKADRACVVGEQTSSDYTLVDEKTHAFAKQGHGGQRMLQYCLRDIGAGVWRVYDVESAP